MSAKLPNLLMRGDVSSRCMMDILRNRKSEYEHMYVSGQETIGHFYLPPFQRPAVWTEEQSASLIESTWLGLPIGSIVVTETGSFDKESDKFPFSSDWLIDGQQRMRALSRYMHADLRIFIGTEFEHDWNDLDEVQKRKWENMSIGFIRIDGNNENDLRELYNRLNFSGTAHTEDQKA